jgi:hypothetical protein
MCYVQDRGGDEGLSSFRGANKHVRMNRSEPPDCVARTGGLRPTGEVAGWAPRVHYR